jgi:hypothetical protein
MVVVEIAVPVYGLLGLPATPTGSGGLNAFAFPELIQNFSGVR